MCESTSKYGRFRSGWYPVIRFEYFVLSNNKFIGNYATTGKTIVTKSDSGNNHSINFNDCIFDYVYNASI